MKRVKKMIEKMLSAWRMEVNGTSDVEITEKKLFNSKLGSATHNQLRKTRLLIFLKTMDFCELLDAVKSVLTENALKKIKAMCFWMAV